MAAAVMESFFQRSLTDLVRSLRAHGSGEAKFLSTAMGEIYSEMKSTDPHTKAVALQKLTYMQMLQGCDMRWASFHVVEVMSMPRFSHKEIGYLAACQSFDDATDVMLLITNLLKKDLGAANQHEAGLALTCLSNIATPDLARDLIPDIHAMLASGRPYIRKKATLVLFKLCVRCPDALHVAFKRLVERLEDVDPSIVMAAVNVFCELALRDPKAYLPLAPELYRLLTTSTNNWLIIKLVKLFGSLARLEPRLGKKLVEPISTIIRQTPAKSLLFECIRTVTIGMADHQGIVRLCIERLREFLEDPDQNLKYLGLRALLHFMTSHAPAVAEYKNLIFRALGDRDPSIQKLALQLVLGLVSDETVEETVDALLRQMPTSDAGFRNSIVASVLRICSKDHYSLVADFPWYIGVLVQLAHAPDSTHGAEVARQLTDIAVRAEAVRSDVVHAVRPLLLDPAILGGGTHHPTVHAVLVAAAWATGEYAEHISDPTETLEAMLQPRVWHLPPSIQAVYLQAILKVFLFTAAAQVSRSPNTPALLETSDTTFEPSSTTGEPVDKTPEPSGATANDASSSLVDGGLTEEVVRQEEILSDAGGEPKRGTIAAMAKLIAGHVGDLDRSQDIEVQERSCALLAVLDMVSEWGVGGHGGALVHVLRDACTEELSPYSSDMQATIPIPEGLELASTLDALHDLESAAHHGSAPDDAENLAGPDYGAAPIFSWPPPPGTRQVGDTNHGAMAAPPGDPPSSSAREALALHRQRHSAFYLPSVPQPADLWTTPGADDSGHRHLAQERDEGAPRPAAKTGRRKTVIVRLDDDVPPLPLAIGKTTTGASDWLSAHASGQRPRKVRTGRSVERRGVGGEVGERTLVEKEGRRRSSSRRRQKNVVGEEQRGGEKLSGEDDERLRSMHHERVPHGMGQGPLLE